MMPGSALSGLRCGRCRSTRFRRSLISGMAPIIDETQKDLQESRCDYLYLFSSISLLFALLTTRGILIVAYICRHVGPYVESGICADRSFHVVMTESHLEVQLYTLAPLRDLFCPHVWCLPPNQRSAYIAEYTVDCKENTQEVSYWMSQLQGKACEGNSFSSRSPWTLLT